jgi:flagellin-like protein
MKGISPLLAAVILVMITVASWSILSGWIQNLSEGQTAVISNQTSNELRCSYADFYIDRFLINCSGTCTSGNTTAIAWVKNSGETSIKFAKLVVQNTTGELFSFALDEAKTVNTGELVNLSSKIPMNCTGFNSSTKVEYVTVASSDCAGLYDSLRGDDVEFSEC